MRYEAAVRYLLSLGRELAAPTQAAAAKFDLENILVLAERLGHPERAYPSTHIAGTNGKGSAAAFLESILRHAGLRTGLNTSPHLEKINERIRINDQEISDEPFGEDRKSTRLNSSHLGISYAVFCLKKKKHKHRQRRAQVVPLDHVGVRVQVRVGQLHPGRNCGQQLGLQHTR